MDNELFEFRIAQANEMAEALKTVNDQNHCVVTYRTFVSTYLPELYQLVTSDTYDTTRWVQLTGNMFAKLVVVNDEQTAVLYELPSILGQGYTASPDPEDSSVNDKLVYAANGKDTLPDIANNVRHHIYMSMATQLDEQYYEETRNNAAKAMSELNRVFKDHNLPLLEVPQGLETVSVKKVEVKEDIKSKGIDLDDSEML